MNTNQSDLLKNISGKWSVITLATCCFIFLCVSCGKKQDNSGFAPKPKGYNRIDLPVAEYQTLMENHPFVFEYSRYAVIKPDTVKWAEPHWLYVYYPAYQAMIQLTYKPLNGDKQKLAKLIADAHKLAAKHSVKAYSIQEFLVKTPSGKYVDMMELEGEVPSQLQFYTTDSTTHYLRGALYFKTALHNDSLAPVINYMKRDINHMLNTLQWKK
ncbi:gliding motility-associated lipoprotein GldD [Pseudarcicella hirudinis]|uniref:Gliding motility-associated lipoprotein GldD n=1 Tax=Pseudarcicella hirudinis TaxID=1079859 RepID=A0A1I5X1N5_9BACT|nr:gliding motility lipoprotein GldD [Pseudarcicella hirudinis]SFQ25925.1 gliding motility-associated lipoprotein GldD [Pseudarcicella hirudinis]